MRQRWHDPSALVRWEQDLPASSELTVRPRATPIAHPVRPVRTPVYMGNYPAPTTGAGLEIAASCDLRVADATAKFAMPEVQVGIPSVIEAAFLPRLVGWGRASRLIYTGETIGADRAHDWGLVDSLVAEGGLDDGIARTVDAICAAGPAAIRPI